MKELLGLPALRSTLPPSCAFSVLLRWRWIPRGHLCLAFAWELVSGISSYPSFDDLEIFEEQLVLMLPFSR